MKHSIACVKVYHCNLFELTLANIRFDKDLSHSANLDIVTTRSYLVVNGPSNTHV